MSRAIDFLRACQEAPRATTRELGEHLGWTATMVQSWQAMLINAGCLRVDGAGRRRKADLTDKGRDTLAGLIPPPRKSATCQQKPQAKTAQTKERRCLMCRNDFPSRWAGERVCLGCKDTEAWRGGSGLNVPVIGSDA